MKSTIKYKLAPISDKWYALHILSLDVENSKPLTINYVNYNNQNVTFDIVHSSAKYRHGYLPNSNITNYYDKEVNTHFWRLDIKTINKPIVVELNKHQYIMLNNSIKLWMDHVNNKLPEMSYIEENVYYFNFKDLK